LPAKKRSHLLKSRSLATRAESARLKNEAGVAIAQARTLIHRIRNAAQGRLNRRALQRVAPFRDLLSAVNQIERLMLLPDAPNHLVEATGLLVTIARQARRDGTITGLVIHLLNVIDDLADRGSSSNVRDTNVANAIKELRAAVAKAARAERTK
jgi:hypothetical protein